MVNRVVVVFAVALVAAGAGWTTAAAQEPRGDPGPFQANMAGLFSASQSSSVIETSTSSLDAGVLPPPAAERPLLQDPPAAQEAPRPAPTHTGLSALVRSTASDFAAFPRRTSTWVILGIGAGAAAIALPFDDEVNDALMDEDGLRKVFKPGKYLGYAWVQAGAAIGLYVTGRYFMEPESGTHTNKMSHLGFDLLRANLITQAFTYGIKVAVQRDRPTGECCAFPSGHASVTFASAAVLERHFGYRASWPMFAIAGYVSASRLTDNRHFVSDVLFGSALGMAAGWTVVGRHGREDFTMVPVPVRGGVALAGSWSPGGPHDRRRSRAG